MNNLPKAWCNQQNHKYLVIPVPKLFLLLHSKTANGKPLWRYLAVPVLKRGMTVGWSNIVAGRKVFSARVRGHPKDVTASDLRPRET